MGRDKVRDFAFIGMAVNPPWGESGTIEKRCILKIIDME
jgi:hypothetical protein